MFDEVETLRKAYTLAQARAEVLAAELGKAQKSADHEAKENEALTRQVKAKDRTIVETLTERDAFQEERDRLRGERREVRERVATLAKLLHVTDDLGDYGPDRSWLTGLLLDAIIAKVRQSEPAPTPVVAGGALGEQMQAAAKIAADQAKLVAFLTRERDVLREAVDDIHKRVHAAYDEQGKLPMPFAVPT